MDEKQAVKTFPFSEFLELQFPPNQYIINEGLLPKRGLMFVGGPPKSYKSFVSNTFAYHLTTGTNIFGAYRNRPGHVTELAFTVSEPQRVLLLEQEIGEYDLRERFLPMYNALPPREQNLLRENLFIHSQDYDLALDLAEGCLRIDRIISEVKPTVVIFDPLVEFHSADENSTQQMSRLLQNLSRLRKRHGFASIINHHTGKPNPDSGRSGPDLLRGNSVLFGKGDSYLMLNPTNRSAGIIDLEFTIRRGRPIHPCQVILDWTELRAKFYAWKGKGAKSPLSDIIQNQLREM